MSTFNTYIHMILQIIESDWPANTLAGSHFQTQAMSPVFALSVQTWLDTTSLKHRTHTWSTATLFGTTNRYGQIRKRFKEGQQGC